MKPTRFFALIYLQSPPSRKKASSASELAEGAQFLLKHVKAAYPDAEAIFSHPNAVIFALADSAPAVDVFKKLAPGLRGTDQLSIVEVGRDIAATHPGLMSWDMKTRFLA